MGLSHDFADVAVGFYAIPWLEFPAGSLFTLAQELVLLCAEPTKLFPLRFLSLTWKTFFTNAFKLSPSHSFLRKPPWYIWCIFHKAPILFKTISSSKSYIKMKDPPMF